MYGILQIQAVMFFRVIRSDETRPSDFVYKATFSPVWPILYFVCHVFLLAWLSWKANESISNAPTRDVITLTYLTAVGHCATVQQDTVTITMCSPDITETSDISMDASVKRCEPPDGGTFLALALTAGVTLFIFIFLFLVNVGLGLPTKLRVPLPVIDIQRQIEKQEETCTHGMAEYKVHVALKNATDSWLHEISKRRHDLKMTSTTDIEDGETIIRVYWATKAQWRVFSNDPTSYSL